MDDVWTVRRHARGAPVAAADLVGESARQLPPVPRQDALLLHRRAPEAPCGVLIGARERAERRAAVVVEVQEMSHLLVASEARPEHRVGLDGEVGEIRAMAVHERRAIHARDLRRPPRHPAVRRETPRRGLDRKHQARE